MLPRSSPAFARISNLSDGLLHAGCYALLAGSRALYETGRRILAVVLFCFALGLVLEFVQPLTGRLSDSRDVVANTAGLVLGLVVARCFRIIASAINRNSNSL